MPRGTQVLSYRVVSQDGHPVAGSLVFSIGAVTGAAAPAGAKSISIVIAGLIWLARIGVYLGLFVGVGGVFFAAWIAWGPYGEKMIIGSLKSVLSARRFRSLCRGSICSTFRSAPC